MGVTDETAGVAQPRPVRWWAAGVTAAAVAVWALLLVPQPFALPAYLALAVAWGIAIGIDVARHELPDRHTLMGFLVFVALLLPVAAAGPGLAHWGMMLLAAGLNALLLFVLAFINPRGIGLGDVKLGLSTGAALGWLAPNWAGVIFALLGTAVGFVLFALTGVVLLLTRRAGRNTDIAFGPFMVAGVLLAPAVVGLLFG